MSGLFYRQFGARLRAARRQAGYQSAEDFAGQAGMSTAHLYAYERGNANMSLGQAAITARLLGVSLDSLVGLPSAESGEDRAPAGEGGPDQDCFAVHLGKVRRAAGFKTDAEFAGKIKMPVADYRACEHGMAVPTLERATTIAKTLGVSLDSLVWSAPSAEQAAEQMPELEFTPAPAKPAEFDRGRFAANLKAARERAGYPSDAAFAQEMGLLPGDYAGCEEGLVTPSLEELVAMAGGLGVSVDVLLGSPTASAWPQTTPPLSTTAVAPSDFDRSGFAVRLRAARRRAGYPTAQAFAEAIGLNASTYARYEGGRIAPTADWVAALSVSLGVSSDYLLGCGCHLEIDRRLQETELDEAAMLETYRMLGPDAKRELRSEATRLACAEFVLHEPEMGERDAGERGMEI